MNKHRCHAKRYKRDQTNENQNDYYTDDGNSDFKNCIPKWKIKKTQHKNKITNQIYEWREDEKDRRRIQNFNNNNQIENSLFFFVSVFFQRNPEKIYINILWRERDETRLWVVVGSFFHHHHVSFQEIKTHKKTTILMSTCINVSNIVSSLFDHSGLCNLNLLPSDFQCFKLIINLFEFPGDWTRNGYWDERREKERKKNKSENRFWDAYIYPIPNTLYTNQWIYIPSRSDDGIDFVLSFILKRN